MENKKWKTLEPQTWRPSKEKESIEGVLIAKVVRDNGSGSKYYLEGKNGPVLVWGSAILDERMMFAKTGDLIRITYDGKNDYNEYRMNLYTVQVAETKSESNTENSKPATAVA